MSAAGGETEDQAGRGQLSAASRRWAAALGYPPWLYDPAQVAAELSATVAAQPAKKPAESKRLLPTAVAATAQPQPSASTRANKNPPVASTSIAEAASDWGVIIEGVVLAPNAEAPGIVADILRSIGITAGELALAPGDAKRLLVFGGAGAAAALHPCAIHTLAPERLAADPAAKRDLWRRLKPLINPAGGVAKSPLQ